MTDVLISTSRLVFPLLYGACFVVLLWQAFRVMARGFGAVTPLQPGHQSEPAASNRAQGSASDRTGRLTIHPELLDADGQLTREDLLTVRFGGESEPPREATE